MISTTVGSYPKVAERAYSTKLIGAISRWQRKELNDAQLEEAFRDVTRAVIREQEDAGVDLLTDGQIRWEDLVTPIAKRLDGFEINGLTRWFNNNTYYRRPVLTGAPRFRGPILAADYRFAQSCAKRPVKAVLPGPYTFAVVSEDKHFKQLRPFVLAMAEILNQEAAALVAAGAPVVQFDEPAIGFGLPGRQAGKTDIKLAVAALNIATQGLSATTAVYTYFGALNGALAPLMKANVDVLGIDLVSEPKTLAALKQTKITKALAVGCLDARNTKLETVKELHAVFKAVSKLVPADRLTVNPNCGLEFLPHPQALAKVKRLAEAVRTFNG